MSLEVVNERAVEHAQTNRNHAQPDQRREGRENQRLGEQLLGYVENLANSQGARRLLLSTTPFLERAIRLYESFGFERTDEGPHDLHGTPLLTMQKLL